MLAGWARPVTDVGVINEAAAVLAGCRRAGGAQYLVLTYPLCPGSSVSLLRKNCSTRTRRLSQARGCGCNGY